MPASNYLQAKIADHTLGKTSWTMPTNVYIALCTAEVADTDTGTTITEASYTSYARVQTSGSDWNAYTSDESSNANSIDFPACTGSSSTATHFAILDASTDGNLLLFDALDASLAISTGITPSFEADTLTVTVT
ncbi:phage tail fiber protein [Gimesia maris]|uniref:phage tail fiber protein n=1 Tax=Gimesia maris TaxID=122 RepID=UPI0032EB3896